MYFATTKIFDFFFDAGVVLFWCFPGIVVRHYLVNQFKYTGNLVFAVLYAQVIGCTLLGLINSVKKKFQRLLLLSSIIYTGLTSGLCGSITTFSTWQFDVFSIIIGLTPYQLSIKHKIYSVLSQLIFTTASSCAAYDFGIHLGELMFDNYTDEPSPLIDQNNNIEQNNLSSDNLAAQSTGQPNVVLKGQTCLSSPASASLVNRANSNNRNYKANGVSFGQSLIDMSQQDTTAQTPNSRNLSIYFERGFSILGWIACVFFATFTGIKYQSITNNSNWNLLLAITFGPLGGFFRWTLSKINKPEYFIPYGTLSANLIAVVILTTSNILGSSSSTFNRCLFLKSGLGFGLSGCLSTVSTFTFEILQLRRRNAYSYYFISILVSQVLSLVVFKIIGKPVDFLINSQDC
ncbi:hypothetical protein BB561_001062 [Smittium simulii]|uniref:Fluoride ion transporter CrcB n=1 Tax=Smittium simulii TaxID=133385 RepID=A0A2T9YW77_9FUNG|nr:hypothetical protein BB561_001062 [Smittium simulii]